MTPKGRKSSAQLAPTSMEALAERLATAWRARDFLKTLNAGEKLPPNYIVARRAIVQATLEHSSNLSFKKKELQEVIKLVFEKGQKTWELPVQQEHAGQWQEAMLKSLQSMLRTVGKALRKKPPPNWIKNLELPVVAIDVDEGEASETDEQPNHDPEEGEDEQEPEHEGKKRSMARTSLSRPS